ncbi:hypothetical protein [Winogradskyella sp. PE311]|uniref:hypothetical protein n=1 Tax=Winogradskyella sp. PE311 TaxID=3366943 RepID=UPI00397EC627
MELPKKKQKQVVAPFVSLDNVDFTKSLLKKQVSTSPLVSGGTNFQTHVLKQSHNSIIRYNPSFGGILFVSIFFIVGLALVFFNFVNYKGLFSSPSISNFFTLAIGLVFSFAGAYIGFRLFKPRIFNKNLGYYYKAYKVKLNTKNCIALKSIVALQIIGESISSKNGSYGSFELNLVLKDGLRTNVIDHGSLKSIISDAYVISEFLNIPIWHAET